jgi:hypothetical protein
MTMKTITRPIALIALAVLSVPAYAVGKPEPPKEPAVIKQGQSQGQLQAQGQLQGQDQSQGQSQRADAQALSNSESSAQSGATSSSGGNSQDVNIVNPRQAPGVGQGSFAIQGCGVAGNAGGSNVNGSAFLGFGFTPEQCYDFMLAQSYQSLGAYEAACEVLNYSRAGKRAQRRGVALPACKAPTPPAPVTPAPLLPAVITVEVKDDAKCTEKVNRVFERCVSK